MAASSQQPDWERRLNNVTNWGLYHWIWFVNLGVLVYAGLPWLSPLARSAGLETLGRILFLIYAPFCHQRPERSFFVNGYQVAFCHRDVAIYTALLVGGVAFLALRERIKPLSFRIGALLMLPMVLDGSLHLLEDLFSFGVRNGADAIGTPNFWLRMVTGVLFAIGIVLTVYTRMDRDLRRTANLVSSTP